MKHCCLPLVLGLSLVWSQNDESCVTSRGKEGICVPEFFCPGYTDTDTSNTIDNDTCNNGKTGAMVCCHLSMISPNMFDEFKYSKDVSVSSTSGATLALETSTTNSRSVSEEMSNFISSTASSIQVSFEFSAISSSDQRISSSTPETTSSKEESSSVASSTASSVTDNPIASSSSPEMPMSTRTPVTKLTKEDFESEFPEPTVCGESKAILSRVVGGVDANLGDFPWIGRIAYNVTGGFKFKCGASLITSHHVLTAAHCIYGVEDTIYFVRLGELDTDDHSQTTPVDAVVKASIPHESYTKENYTNDIGILVFYKRVRFTEFIRPICLPLSSELRSKNFERYNPFVTGWGRIKYKGPFPNRLQVLQLPVVSQRTCKEAYAPLRIPIDERVICVGGMGGKDACNGDSGGPLMQPIWDPINYTSSFYQTGIVSFGVKCGTPGYPTVFTRVTEFIPWIQKQVLGK